MTCAFIVLTHMGPENLARLSSRLDPHEVHVHVDSKLGKSEFDAFVSKTARLPNVSFVARHRSAWASWGLVAAAMEGLKAAMKSSAWSHVMLLSGQDYPLMSAEEMRLFFDAHRELSFVAHWRLPTSLWGKDGGMRRVRYWHQPMLGKRVFIPIPRRHPADIAPVGGPMYWCLNREAATALLEFFETRQEVVNFYRHVWIPDELFVPTAVMNGPCSQQVAGEALTYIRWSNPGSAHPDMLTLEDGPKLLAAAAHGSGVGGHARRKLFARKINYVRDRALLDFLDQAAI
ncbi:MAG: beta-1,6-N-acetylglucosaminyltransferase [Pseudomonadota bacterium]